MMGGTIKDVARVAGVSIATVSRVLNGNYPVSESTRAKVEKAIRLTNYSVDHVARSLVTGATHTIGVIGTEIVNPYFAEMLHHIQRHAGTHAYQVLFQSTGTPEAEVQAVHTLLDRRVDGIIMVARQEAAHDVAHIAHAAEKVPVVLVGMPLNVPGVYNVYAREDEGMAALGAHLAANGHRRFLFLGGSPESFPTSARLKGLRQALASWGDECRVDVVYGGYGFENAADALDDAYRKPAPRRWTAVVCVSDYVAMGALHVMHRKGVRVPDEVTVTGFDDVLPARLMYPPLTTVDLQKSALAQTAIQTIVDVSPHAPGTARDDTPRDDTTRDITLAPTVVWRSSHGPAPAGPSGG